MQAKKVAILESRLGRQLVELVAKRGGVPFHAPALAEIADADPGRIALLVRELESRPAKLAIFQTGVGTHALFKATDALELTANLLALLEKTLVAVRGPKPTAALRARRVRIDLEAREPFTTTEVLQALKDVPLAGERVLVQRYGATNAELEDGLRARGAQEIEVPTYRWSLPEDTKPLVELIAALAQRRIDAVAFTNAAQVHNLFTVAQRSGSAESLRADLNRTLVASIGPVASKALSEFGVKVDLEARPPKLGPLIEALDAALSREIP